MKKIHKGDFVLWTRSFYPSRMDCNGSRVIIKVLKVRKYVFLGELVTGECYGMGAVDFKRGFKKSLFYRGFVKKVVKRISFDYRRKNPKYLYLLSKKQKKQFDRWDKMGEENIRRFGSEFDNSYVREFIIDNA